MAQLEKTHIKSTAKVIGSYLKLYKKEIVLLSILSIFSAIGNALVPLLAGKLFDTIGSTDTVTLFFGTMKVVWAILTTWIIVQLVTSVIDWKISIDSLRLSMFVRARYSFDAYVSLLLKPLGFHKTHKLTEIDSKISRAAYSIETIFGRVLIDLAPQFISIIISLFVTFYINAYLTLILIAGIVVYVLTAWRKVSDTGDLQDQGFDVWNESFGYAGDLMQNITAVKQAVAEKHETENLSKRFNNRLVDVWLKLEEIWNNLRYYQRIIVLLAQIIIFGISIVLITNGEMTIGELVAFNAYAALVFGPFVTIMTNWQVIHNGVTNIGKTDKTISVPSEAYTSENKVHLPEIKGGITFDNVSFYYHEDKEILNDINFEVKPGEVIALVGESGVGKSTLVDMISAYHFPVTGKVLIDGVEIEKIDLNQLRKSIAVVPQEVVLFNDTIKHNIAYGNFEATQEQLEESAQKAYALDFINKFPDKWEQMVGERGVKLSVGQKQRVAIARAILRSPKILILDEPTSALDAGSEKIITESLEKLMEGKTTFIIAHRLSTVRKADKILVFKEGRIIESGTHQELLQIEGGEYKRLHDLQIGLHD